MLDLEVIRKSLESERQLLQKHIKKMGKETSRVTSFAPAHSDLAWHCDSQQRLRLLRAQADSKLAQVEEALKRLDSGEYGKCVNCGKPIHPDRLKAMPSATVCINCKRKNE
jgi:DnaK suppressor protein